MGRRLGSDLTEHCIYEDIYSPCSGPVTGPKRPVGMCMIMYSTLCQMKCLVHIKPREKLCEGKLNSKQKVLHGHLVLFFCPSFYLSRSPLSPKVINKTPRTSLTWTETPKGISLSLGFYRSRSFTQAYKSPGPAHVFPSPSTL